MSDEISKFGKKITVHLIFQGKSILPITTVHLEFRGFNQGLIKNLMKCLTLELRKFLFRYFT